LLKYWHKGLLRGMGEGSWEIAPWGRGGGKKREKASKKKEIFLKKRTTEKIKFWA
jgi:hypothetical protein